MPASRSCLSEIELGSYVEGNVSPETARASEEHLSRCALCREELRAAEVILSPGDGPEIHGPPENIMRRAVDMFPGKSGMFDIVLRLLRDSIEILRNSHAIHVLAPAPAPSVRGIKIVRPNMIILTKSFEDIEIELNVEKVLGDLCNVKVFAVDVNTKSLVNNLRIELVSAGRELESSFLKNGESVFEDIRPGRYGIRIRKGKKIFGELTFKIVE